MQQLTNTIEEYKQLAPEDYHELDTLELSNQPYDTANQIVLTIVLRHNNDSARKLIVTFYGVHQFRYHPADMSLLTCWPLDIVSIASLQWEGKNYKVFETEMDNELFFTCRDFSAKVIQDR